MQKAKNVIFRNGGKLYDNEKFYINDNTEIEVVNKFTYLAFVFIIIGNGLKPKNNWLCKAAKRCLL